MPTRIVEGKLPYSGGTGIEIDANKVISLLLREQNNLILVNDNNEIYTDLQLADGIKPTDEFPVGVTVGRVLSADGWYMSGTMLNFQTTSGDYGRWIYGTDGHIYYDAGTGTWQQIYTGPEVDALFQQLRNSLATVAFTGDYNDLLNRPPQQTVNDPAITVNQNGVQAGKFTLNQATPDTINLTDTTYPTMTAGELGTGTDTTDRVVSAKVIADYVKGKIDTLLALGKFLSLWDATTGQPISFPLATPYTYTTGDYFLVETVSSATPPVNYRPNGSSYTGSASSTPETDELDVGDIYIYDGTTWLLQINHGKSVSFANLAGQPTDNANLATALSAKQDVLTAGDGINITGSTIRNTGVLSSNNTYDNIIHMSQADYDALATKDPDTLYSTPDGLDNGDLNTKTFELTGTTGQTNIDTAQDIYNWYSIGNNPLILYNDYIYVLANATASALIFRGGLAQENQNSSTFIKQDVIQINLSSDTVTSINLDVYVAGGSYLRLGQHYTTPYIPTDDGEPTSKKYVDEHGPNIPVYYYSGDFNSNITFNMIEAGEYRLYVRAYHGTTVDKTLTLTVDGTTIGTITSNLIENLNASINFTASAGSTVVLSVSSKTSFTIQEVYIEKVNIQSGYLTATVN